MGKRSIVSVAALGAASVLLLAGCASGSTSPAGTTAPTAAGGTVAVVASTNVYGEIAKEVGGDHVSVTSLISSVSQDPHEYEAGAKDQLTVKEAGLLIENGGGYDPFLDGLIEASGSTAPVITAATFSPGYTAEDDHADETHTEDAHAGGAEHSEDAHAGDDHDHIEGFNEHVFYDPATMALVADAIAKELSAIDPDNAGDFTANAKTFSDGIADLQASLDTIKSAHSRDTVFVTEPLPLYLTEAAGLSNVTPEAFSEAVEEGQDVPPATLLEALNLVPTVSVVITNAQAAGAETTQVEQKAEGAGIPVLKFSEILPDGQTYLGWMTDNVTQLSKALGS